tara:strand:- start:188 stop:1036 length:849 start_codon:yes stop_codon:yes gene_type:complete
MKQKTSSLISLENAGFFRSGRWLVRGVNLTVNSGEILTLIGPNGSGKSTTAKMAIGVAKPDEGDASKRQGLKISYLPQRISIDWTLPIKVNRFMNLTGQVRRKEANEALYLTGALHLAKSDVRTLSGGEFQRVLMARAIARKPELIVLDEPVQGVDFRGEIEIYELIRNIRDELKCGVLLISHDLHVVMAATDHVICLNGHVCCSGTPMNVANSKEYKALFGARAVSGLALYEHRHDHQHLPDGSVQSKNGNIDDGCSSDRGGQPHIYKHSFENNRADNHDG